MVGVKKSFVLNRSVLGKKFRVENNGLDLDPILSNSSLAVKKIRDVAPSHREERNKKATVDNVIKYIQISDIDVQLGRIKSFRRFRGGTAPNNARRLVKEGDVLVSTRRPTRGAVATIPPEFDGEVCTVFFTTLRVLDRNICDPGFLSLFLRTSIGRIQFQSLITETAYPVITDDDVENMTILLPPIDEQRAVAKSYGNSVEKFFGELNSAYQDVTNARQLVEDLVMRSEAEKIPVTSFGLIEEATDLGDDDSPDVVVE